MHLHCLPGIRLHVNTRTDSRLTSPNPSLAKPVTPTVSQIVAVPPLETEPQQLCTSGRHEGLLARQICSRSVASEMLSALGNLEDEVISARLYLSRPSLALRYLPIKHEVEVWHSVLLPEDTFQVRSI
jgi:hypothetical protein